MPQKAIHYPLTTEEVEPSLILLLFALILIITVIVWDSTSILIITHIIDSYHSPTVHDCTVNVVTRAKYNELMICNILCSRLNATAVLGTDSVAVPVTTEYV